MTPAMIGDAVSSPCCSFCQTVREDTAIVDTRMVVFEFRFALFPCMSAGRHSDSTPGSRRVPLCVHDSRLFLTEQAALQTATAVVSSHELVSRGNEVGSTLRSRPAAMLSKCQFAH